MKFNVLTLRFEHGAGGELIDAAKELVDAANTFGCMTIMNLNRVGDMFAFTDEDPEVVLVRWKTSYVKPASDRPRTYTCEFCGAASSKDLWGPGRITCPLCNKMARAADGTDRNK